MALAVLYVPPDSLSKAAWSLPWDAETLDKIEMLPPRRARLAQLLNTATLLDTRSNHIMVKLFFRFNRMQTDDMFWHRGHQVFVDVIEHFAGDIKTRLSPAQLTAISIPLAR